MIAAVLLILFSAAAQIVLPQTHDPRYPQFAGSNVIDQARALPAEFQADILLRIAESPLVQSTSQKKKLIEEAFWSGAHATLPYMQKVDGGADSVASNGVRANRLESLTLQTRAVQQMLPPDPARAALLFERVSPIALPRLKCADMSTPELVDYYQAAVLVFDKAFTPAERSREEDINLLRRLVNSIEAPAQVPPAIEMLFAARLNSNQRGELMSVLSGRLQEISRSDREYGAAEGALVSALTVEHLRSPNAVILLPALRSYIVRHVSGRRCTNNIPAAGKSPASVEKFNDLARAFDASEAQYKPISSEEAKPDGDDGTYQTLIGQSKPSQAVQEALRWLTHGNRERDGQVVRWTLKERSSQNWLVRYDDAVKLVHDLKESDEKSPEAFFCMKADALNLLATLAPPGSARDKAMEEYREFLEEYYSSIENPNLWFTMFRHILYTARFSEDPKDKAWILGELARSSNPIITVYAKVETLIGPPPRGTYPPAHVEPAHK
jgi:hypothetical protein